MQTSRFTKVFEGKVQDLYSTTIKGLTLLVAAFDPYQAAVVRTFGDYPNALFIAPVDQEDHTVRSDGIVSTYGLVAVSVGHKELVVVTVQQVKALDLVDGVEIEENIDGTLRLS
jgi:hypothetical protein